MNTFGNKFRVSIFGESHGPRIGVTLDGVLPGIPLTEADFTADLARRKAGAPGTTPRVENDLPEIVSGVYEGHTTGAPLTILFRNENTRSQDYEQFRKHPRPGQADFTANLKFGGFNDPRGGGHFSGRLTLGLVAAAGGPEGGPGGRRLPGRGGGMHRGRRSHRPGRTLLEQCGKPNFPCHLCHSRRTRH